MPTANERKALWFLALVALSGGAVRLWRANSTLPLAPADSLALERQLQRVDSARTTVRSRKARAGGARGDPTPMASVIDLDRANATEIEALPGIGPQLAKRIVSHRDSAGIFGGIRGLCAVRGIGPSLAEKLRPLVTFNGARSPLSDGCDDASTSTRRASPARPSQPR